MRLAVKMNLRSGQSFEGSMIKWQISLRKRVCKHLTLRVYLIWMDFQTNYSTETSLDGSRSKFNSKIMVARWLCTNGARIILQFSYQKRPMFYIPKNWIPYYAEWVLSFPRAPLGSISLQIWSLSCKAFVTLLLDASLYFISLFRNTKPVLQNQRPRPVNTSIDTIVAAKRNS